MPELQLLPAKRSIAVQEQLELACIEQIAFDSADDTPDESARDDGAEVFEEEQEPLIMIVDHRWVPCGVSVGRRTKSPKAFVETFGCAENFSDSKTSMFMVFLESNSATCSM